MGWEEIATRRHPCPCGKGEYEESSQSDDWGRSHVEFRMLCPQCAVDYEYVRQPAGHHLGRWDGPARGWTLRSVLAAEQRHRDEVTANARRLYWDAWRAKFAGAGTRKRIWEILTRHGLHYPCYNTFCDHNRAKSPDEIDAYVNRFFAYHSLRQVFEVCGVRPDWDALGVTPEEAQRMEPDLSRSLDEPLADAEALRRRLKPGTKVLVRALRTREWLECTVRGTSILRGGNLRIRHERRHGPGILRGHIDHALQLVANGKLRYEEDSGCWRLDD